jgi:hypothetical protein
VDISAEMVRRGVARDCPRFSGGRYHAIEAQAASDGATIGRSTGYRGIADLDHETWAVRDRRQNSLQPWRDLRTLDKGELGS